MTEFFYKINISDEVVELHDHNIENNIQFQNKDQTDFKHKLNNENLEKLQTELKYKSNTNKKQIYYILEMINSEFINIYTSSGNSIVFSPKNHNIVYQWLVSEIYFKIKLITNILIDNINYDITNYISYSHKLKYKRENKHIPTLNKSWNINNYITTKVNSNDNLQLIEWNKIDHVRNRMNNQQFSQFIKNNLYKLIWDLGKSLYSIHSKGIIHGDSRLDNTGIKNNNFCFFDFDSSKIHSDNINFNDLIIKDYRNFKHSILFNLYSEDINLQIIDMIDYKIIFNLMTFIINNNIHIDTYDKAYTYLDNLTIF